MSSSALSMVTVLPNRSSISQPANSAGSSSRLAPAPVASPNVFVHPNVANVGTTQTPTWPNVETHMLGVRMVALVKIHSKKNQPAGFLLAANYLPAPMTS